MLRNRSTEAERAAAKSDTWWAAGRYPIVTAVRGPLQIEPIYVHRLYLF
jgi:hypothetical protein